MSYVSCHDALWMKVRVLHKLSGSWSVGFMSGNSMLVIRSTYLHTYWVSSVLIQKRNCTDMWFLSSWTGAESIGSTSIIAGKSWVVANMETISMDSTLPCILMDNWSEKSDSDDDIHADNEEFEDELIGSLVPSRRALCGQLLRPISSQGSHQVVLTY